MRKALAYVLLTIFSALSIYLVLYFYENKTNILYVSPDRQIKILDGKYKARPARFLRMGNSHSSCMFLDTESPLDMPYEYTKYSFLYKTLNSNIDNVLIMGAGAYSVPKALLAGLPNARIDVCDIEPRLFALAKQYFKLTDSPRLNNIAIDCRRFLHSVRKKYDFIFVDVYSANSTPEQFITKEFFTLAKSQLNDRGVIVMNVIGDISKTLYPSFALSELKTFLSVFPNSYVFGVRCGAEKGKQNIILLGYNSKVEMPLQLTSELKFAQDKLINVNSFNLDKYLIFSDSKFNKGGH